MKTEAPTEGSASTATPAVAFQHVLVPVDGSDFAAVALDSAATLAFRFGARLNAVQVVTDEVGRDDAQASARLVSSGAHVEIIAGGDPATEIGRYASGLGSCLVCLSTHGHGRVAGSVVGSVARSILSQSAMPIVAVGPSARAPSFVDRWPAPLSVPVLVACVDGTESAEAVLPIAAAWANALTMALTILIVAEPAPAELRPSPTPKAGNLTAAEAASYVAGLASAWEHQALDVTGVVALDPISTAEGVKAYLDAHPAGLVAAATHHRRGVKRLLFGATAASIVHASVVPVLLVPLDG